jgi:hypothetical protein
MTCLDAYANVQWQEYLAVFAVRILQSSSKRDIDRFFLFYKDTQTIGLLSPLQTN